MNWVLSPDPVHAGIGQRISGFRTRMVGEECTFCRFGPPCISWLSQLQVLEETKMILSYPPLTTTPNPPYWTHISFYFSLSLLFFIVFIVFFILSFISQLPVFSNPDSWMKVEHHTPLIVVTPMQLSTTNLFFLVCVFTSESTTSGILSKHVKCDTFHIYRTRV